MNSLKRGVCDLYSSRSGITRFGSMGIISADSSVGTMPPQMLSAPLMSWQKYVILVEYPNKKRLFLEGDYVAKIR